MHTEIDCWLWSMKIDWLLVVFIEMTYTWTYVKHRFSVWQHKIITFNRCNIEWVTAKGPNKITNLMSLIIRLTTKITIQRMRGRRTEKKIAKWMLTPRHHSFIGMSWTVFIKYQMKRASNLTSFVSFTFFNSKHKMTWKYTTHAQSRIVHELN